MDIQEKLAWLYHSIKGHNHRVDPTQGTSGKFKMALKQIESSKDLGSAILKHVRSCIVLDSSIRGMEYKVGYDIVCCR
jgi:hypothetical protein